MGGEVFDAVVMTVVAGALEVGEEVVVYFLEVFLLVSSEPSHDIEYFILIYINPQFHPFSDIKDAELFDIGIYFFAVVFDIFID